MTHVISAKDRGGLWKVRQRKSFCDVCYIALKRQKDKFLQNHQISIKELNEGLMKVLCCQPSIAMYMALLIQKLQWRILLIS